MSVGDNSEEDDIVFGNCMKPFRTRCFRQIH